jgi:hypothetical protein
MPASEPSSAKALPRLRDLAHQEYIVMSSAAAEPAEKISHATPVKSVETVETTVEPISDAVTKTSAAAEKMVKENAATLAESGSAATTAFQELAKAYQELASKNAKNLAAAIHALSSVKSITEFIDLEQKLIKEGVAAAVSDSTQIARLTAAVFTAAIDPVKKRIETARK